MQGTNIATVPNDSFFSGTYVAARRRFLDAATSLDANIRSYKVQRDGPDSLSVDVAIVGGDQRTAVVVSSGLHGVEGFFGSAVQLALLNRLQQANGPDSLRYVLIHAVNPFGFSRLRRVNEDNVDLNRNFLPNQRDFIGAPVGYDRLDYLLNPASPPSRFEPFAVKAYRQILRTGLQPLKEAVAGGQYEYPRGLFYGGAGPCASTRIVQAEGDEWLGSAEKVVHFDLHTGLGRFANYMLILPTSTDPVDHAWYARTFGSGHIERPAAHHAMAYQALGAWGEWQRGRFATRDYRFILAEFGTYPIIRVLAALRAENRAHFFSSPGSGPFDRTKRELLECFCPSSRRWRRQAVTAALEIIRQGTVGLLED